MSVSKLLQTSRYNVMGRSTVARYDSRNRRGSVLLVVIGMLGILLLTGIAFYTFASQENSSAEYYSDAAKAPAAPKMVADALFDYSLEQLIIGPHDSLIQSALRGGRIEPTAGNIQIPGRHSLLAGVIGNDGAFYNGQGIRVTVDSSGITPIVDMSGDGMSDNPEYLNLNASAAANGGTLPNITGYPAVDTGFTTPDINSPYLGYAAVAPSANYPTQFPFVIPSFHRPQYLRTGAGAITAPGNGAKVFRPHPDHVCKSATRRRYLPAFPMNANSDGSAISQGVWDLTTEAVTPTGYNWDVDNDGDGSNEGVWLDLDHPIVPLGDGRSCIPMFSFTVRDADGLINLNTSGNISAWDPPPSAPFNPNGPPASIPAVSFVHRSNLGLSRSEINPLWGMYADASLDPGTDSTYFDTMSDLDKAILQERIFWNMPSGAFPASSLPYLYTANMDLLSLLHGRVDFTRAQPPVGTYAIDGLQYTTSRYIPGRRGESGILSSQVAQVGGTSTTLNATMLPKPGQAGVDDDFDNSTTVFPNNSLFLEMGHPIDYLGYGSTYQLNGSTSAITQMLVGSVAEPLNPVRWPAYNGYENMASRVDYANTNSSELFRNQRMNVMSDEEDESIADPSLPQFSSHDSMFDSAEMFGLHGSATDFNNSANTSRIRDLAPFNFVHNKQSAAIRSQFTTLSMDRFQFGAGFGAVEVTADENFDSNREFPPYTISPDLTDPREPIREPVRRQVAVEYGRGLLNSASGFKLNMNQLMTRDSAGNLVSRDLTPHYQGDIGASDVVPVPYTPGSFTPAGQEYWARKDRQQLARDIYVLLYLFCGPDPTLSYSTVTPSPYNDDRLAEMAQFAVNYVDALDSDTNVTRFEYDKNVGDGWDQDDDPYITTGDKDRGEVFGVEHQGLAFSEGVVIRTAKLGNDRTEVTTFKDNDVDRLFMGLELINASPYQCDLNYKSWRIRILDSTAPANERTLGFTINTNSVAPGGRLTIGSRFGDDADSDGNPRPSHFRVNYNFDDPASGESAGSYSYDTVVPYIARGTPALENTPDPGTAYDIDLVVPSHASRFEIDGGATPGSEFIRDAGNDVTFVIERRADLFRDSTASVGDNPWIEVDKMVVTVRDCNLSGDYMALQTTLESVRSLERPEPFLAAKETSSNQSPVYLQNSIGEIRNTNSSSVNRVWQAHFDRPFTSPMDLLTIPLFGPKSVTRRLGDGITWGATPAFAQEKFLRSIHPVNAPTTTDASLNNRWFRLLDFLAIEGRTQSAVVSSPARLRTPGLVNLNTIRHRGVFAGLVDDLSLQFASGATDASTPTQYTGHFGLHASNNPAGMAVDVQPDAADGAVRDWFLEFQRARDVEDQVTKLYLPGTAVSRPFQNFSFAGASEDSVLRSLPKDSSLAARRGLFEASRNYNEASLDTSVDLHTRHRLLRKVVNNSTTRSNVFMVWVSVGFFEAVEHSDGDVQIGAPLNGDGAPTHRGFFVVDRSLPEAALDPVTQKFDFRRFVQYRKTIR